MTDKTNNPLSDESPSYNRQPCWTPAIRLSAFLHQTNFSHSTSSQSSFPEFILVSQLIKKDKSLLIRLLLLASFLDSPFVMPGHSIKRHVWCKTTVYCISEKFNVLTNKFHVCVFTRLIRQLMCNILTADGCISLNILLY